MATQSLTRHMTVKELKELHDKGVALQLVDVRSPQEFAEAHIPGAVNVPMEEVEARLDDITRSTEVVLVCQSGTRAGLTCDLIRHEREHLHVLEGGTQAWLDAGHPVVGSPRKTKLSLMRQVQLLVGPLTLIGAVLAIYVNPSWAWLTAAIGAGLTVAGSTGFCGMAVLLAKMPWNQSSRGARNCEVPAQ